MVHISLYELNYYDVRMHLINPIHAPYSGYWSAKNRGYLSKVGFKERHNSIQEGIVDHK